MLTATEKGKQKNFWKSTYFNKILGDKNCDFSYTYDKRYQDQAILVSLKSLKSVVVTDETIFSEFSVETKHIRRDKYFNAHLSNSRMIKVIFKTSLCF